MHLYYCKDCGNERDGLLDHPAGMGGYSWHCPQCKSANIGSFESEVGAIKFKNKAIKSVNGENT